MFVRPVKEIAVSGATRGVSRLFAAWRAFVKRLRRHSAGAEIRRLESRKLDRYQEMGRIVYQMYLEDRVRTKRLRGLCEAVARLEASSRDVERRLEAMTAEVVNSPRSPQSSGTVGAHPG